MALVLNGSSGTITGLQVNSTNIVDGSIVNADISDLAASKLTGALPAISGASLTGVQTSTVAFYARQGTEHNIATTTWTKIVNLDQDEITQNTGTSWASSRFTVASGQEGVYLLFGGVGIDDIQRVDIVYVRFYKNGSYLDPYEFERAIYSGGSTPNAMTASGTLAFTVNLAVGDYVELFVYHNEGSTEPTEAAVTWFGGFKI